MPSPWRDWIRPATLSGRLMLWNTAVVLAVTASTLLAARFAARTTLYADADAELRGGAREVVLAIEALHPDMAAVVAEIRRKASSHEQRGWFIHLLTEDGTSIWKSEHCPDEVANFAPANVDREENIVQIGPYRYVRLRIAKPGLPAYHVRVGTYTTGLDEHLSSLMRHLMLVGAGLALVTPMVGWWLAQRATRPVADILQVADRLRPTRLGDRLPVRGSRDELDQLATTINRLLDQVAGHVERQQQFTADAAHELRSPLAAVRSALEVALSQDRSAAEYRDALLEVLEETRTLGKLTNDLLELAETASESPRRKPDLLDLAAVVRQAAGMFSGVADERGIAITVETVPAVVLGDAGQMRRVLGNLLDNAIRYTPAGGTVRIHLAVDAVAGRASLTVADSGAGIAARHIDRIFDRFYKVDPARNRRESRTGGLGLPICKAIVERHGGTIALTSLRGQGTTVTIGLPLAAGPHRSAGAALAAAAPA